MLNKMAYLRMLINKDLKDTFKKEDGDEIVYNSKIQNYVFMK